MTASTVPTVERHPIRGALYGLLLGLGIAIYLVIFSVIAFQWTIPIVVAVLGLVAGVAWAMFAPAKGAPPPPAVEPIVDEPRGVADPNDPTLSGSTADQGLPPADDQGAVPPT